MAVLLTAMRNPISASAMTTGASHHFFRSFRKSHRSLANVMAVPPSQHLEQELRDQGMRDRILMLVTVQLVFPICGVDVWDDLVHLEDSNACLPQTLHDHGVVSVVRAPHHHAKPAPISGLEQLL